MSQTPLFSFCRTCLACDTELYFAADKTSIKLSNVLLNEKYQNIASIFPAKVCNECLMELKRFGQFQRQCLRASKVLYEAMADSTCINKTLLKKKHAEIVASLKLRRNFKKSKKSHKTLKRNADIEIPSMSNILREKPIEIDTKDIDVRSDPLNGTGSNPVNIKIEQTSHYMKEEINDLEDFHSREREDECKWQIPGLPIKIKNTSEGFVRKTEVVDENNKRIDENIPDIDNDNSCLHVDDFENGTSGIEINSKKVKSFAMKKKDKAEKKFEKEASQIETNLKKAECFVRKKREKICKKVSLSLERQRAEWAKRGEKARYKMAPFKCDSCFRGFFCSDLLAKHSKLQHSKCAGPEECPVCLRRFATSARLKRHVAMLHRSRYLCLRCDFATNDYNKIGAHQESHMGGSNQCFKCGKTFSKTSSYLGHMRTMHPTQFACNLCGKTFLSNHGVAVHKNYAHKKGLISKLKQEPSDVCKGIEEDANYCIECDVRFASKLALETHLVQSSNHVKSVEVLSRTDCTICGLTILNRDERLRHQRDHDVKAPSAKWNKQKNIMCGVCGKTFRYNYLLTVHNRSHTNEKPFKCAVCNKEFTQKIGLEKHVRIHTNTKPFSCDICKKEFRVKSNLSRHFVVHSKVRAYPCDICGKSFSQMCSKKLHIRTVHMKIPDDYRKDRRKRRDIGKNQEE